MAEVFVFIPAKKLEVVPDVITSTCGNYTATAENNDDNSDDHGGIVLFRLFSDWGHLVVHDFFSSYRMNG